MKVTFVYPRFEKFLSSVNALEEGLADFFLGDFTTPPSLGIPILAALTPPEIEIELVDDNAGQRVDFAADTDLVAINCFTPQASRALAIADGYRAQGKRVIMGGLFPSFMADECLKHADAVNRGEGEPTWPQILADAWAGQLKPIYDGGCSADLARLPMAKRSLFYAHDFYDWDEDLVQLTRGCLYNCAMCALPAHMGNRIRFRPIDQVLEEIRQLKHENIYLADDTLFFPHRKLTEYAKAFFRAVAPLGRKFFVNSTLSLSTDPEIIDLAAQAGVRNFYCTLNVDPISIRALQGEPRERQKLADLVKSLEDRGIRFFASCGLGRDWDDAHISDRYLDLLSAARIHTAEFFIFTPYPGTVHWDRLQRQGRIFDFDWSHYNGAYVVAKPELMTPDQLRAQFVKVWREFHQQQKARHTACLEPATWKEGVQVVGKPLQRQGVIGQAAITGLGLVSPIGCTPEQVTEALRTGRHGLAPVPRFAGLGFRARLFGEVRTLSLSDWLGQAEMEEYEDLYLLYAIAAARQALHHAGLAEVGQKVRRDIGLVLGTCNGGLCSAEAEYAWKHGRSSRPFDAQMHLQAQVYGFGKALASALKLGGEAWVVTTACSSTTVALGLAQMLINRGYYRTVLVGGADTLCLANISGFDALKATAGGQMAPFSMEYGMNVGEGACFWVVEEMEKALLRQARCLGRLAGHATTSDAYHPTTPDPRGQGVCRTLSNALADSGLTLVDIGCINGHGSGTEANDRAESKGAAKFIGDHAIPLVSTKSFFGHCMGVTGILEASCQLLAMNANFIPPTLNFSQPRPGCTLDYVPNTARSKKYPAFISANYAFGGNNAAVVITRPDTPLAHRQALNERVVITGLGVVTAAGLGLPRLMESLRGGKNCLTPITRFPLTGAQERWLGQVPEFKSAEVDRRLDFTNLNNISRYAVAAGKLALDQAGLKISPHTGDDAGVIMGVCNGPSEMGHMDSVFSQAKPMANLTSFSNITANSTAGWVSNALGLKGVNASLSPGPHAALQSLAYAFDALMEKRARVLLAGAADEVYAQTFYNYDMIGALYAGPEEQDYRLHVEDPRRKVLGEGAALAVLEPATTARERQAPVIAEMLSYGMSMDAEGFHAPNLGLAGLQHAVELALTRAQISVGDIDLVVWAPQGNAQDLKVIKTCEALWGERFRSIPLATSTFNTGFIESTSILVSLAAVLTALEIDGQLWPQRTGLPELDARPLLRPPKVILALASTDLGYNFAALFRRDVKL